MFSVIVMEPGCIVGNVFTYPTENDARRGLLAMYRDAAGTTASPRVDVKKSNAVPAPAAKGAEYAELWFEGAEQPRRYMIANDTVDGMPVPEVRGNGRVFSIGTCTGIRPGDIIGNLSYIVGHETTVESGTVIGVHEDRFILQDDKSLDLHEIPFASVGGGNG